MTNPTNGKKPRMRRKPAPIASNGNGAAEGEAQASARSGEFTSSRGITVKINGLSPFLIQALGPDLREEYAEAGSPVDPPTYEIELPGGEKETRDHDATTLKTDEDRAAWAAYQELAAEFTAELQERTMRLLFIRGVQAPPLVDSDEWIEEQKFFGARIPEGKFERRYHWIKTELVSSADETIDLMDRILALSGVGEGALRAAREAFRDSMEKPNGSQTGNAADRGRGLVSQPNAVRGKGRKGNGEVA